MFRTRLISGIVLVLIALVVIITGGPVLAATLFIISEIGVFELYRVLKVQDAGFRRWLQSDILGQPPTMQSYFLPVLHIL